MREVVNISLQGVSFTVESNALELLEQYEVRRCYYGHLHGGSHGLAMEGLWDGIEFRLVAADYIGFKPQLVIL